MSRWEALHGRATSLTFVVGRRPFCYRFFKCAFFDAFWCSNSLCNLYYSTCRGGLGWRVKGRRLLGQCNFRPKSWIMGCYGRFLCENGWFSCENWIELHNRPGWFYNPVHPCQRAIKIHIWTATCWLLIFWFLLTYTLSLTILADVKCSRSGIVPGEV